MKKIILLIFAALMMTGCEEKELKEIKGRMNDSFKDVSVLRHGMIVDIDSCQYIVCDAYGGWSYVHHNNCRFCKERRKQEAEALVEQLKEK